MLNLLIGRVNTFKIWTSLGNK